MRQRLRPSRPGDEDWLRALWKVCFQEDDTYLNWYFSRCYTPGQGLVLEADGKIVSMLLTFSQEMIIPSGPAMPACYVYAFCTHPAVQGRGYGRCLLAYAEEQAARKGSRGMIMVPSEETLFDFYRTLGYTTAFSTWEEQVTREEEMDPADALCPCTLAEYQRLRAAWLQGRRWIRYPEETAIWQEQLCIGSGGGLYRMGTDIAAVERWGGMVVVKELLAEHPAATAQALLVTLGAESALIRRPVPEGTMGKPFGVLKCLDQFGERLWQGHRDGYLAFAFD